MLTLRIGPLRECESLKIPLFVLSQSGQRVVLSNDQWPSRTAVWTPRRRIGQRDPLARARGLLFQWITPAWITEAGRLVVHAHARHGQSPCTALSTVCVFVS